MKKLTVILLVAILGMLLLNVMTSTTNADDPTLWSLMNEFHILINETLTVEELNTLETQVTQKEIMDAIELADEWTAFIGILTKMEAIVAER